MSNDSNLVIKNKKVKVLRLRTGEFLYRVNPDKLETTAHIKHALDIKELDVYTLADIMQTLHNIGGYKPEVIEVNRDIFELTATIEIE